MWDLSSPIRELWAFPGSYWARGRVCAVLCLVAQLCPTLYDPLDCSMPGFPVLHHLPEFAQNSGPLSQWCHITISSSVSPFSSCLQSFLASGSFPMSQLFASGGQSIGASASVSVLPMNIQDWFLLGLIGLISLLSKELSRVFSSTTLWKHSAQPSVLSLPYGPILTSVHDYWIAWAGPTKSLCFTSCCSYVYLISSPYSTCLLVCSV